MKKLLYILPLLLSGCYLANGSPPEPEYWLKKGNKISYEEMVFCGEQIIPSLGDRYIYLTEKRMQLGLIEFRKNKEEYEEYYSYLVMASKLERKCYYELGYRFKAPTYWCLAQDGYHNTRTCIENMKYRN